jgi:hypothetical protein
MKYFCHRIIFALNPRESKVFQWVPFDIKKSLPKSAFSKMMVVMNYLLAMNVNLRPSDGTLLGILRDRQLIEHDNDVDFDVIHSLEAVDAIREFFSKKEYKKCREVIYRGRVQQLTFYDSEHVIYDFIFWFYDGHYGINFSEPGYLRIMPKEFIFDLTYLLIENNRIPVPSNSEGWLNFRYGKSWATPQSEKKDWKDDCGDLVKLWG